MSTSNTNSMSMSNLKDLVPNVKKMVQISWDHLHEAQAVPEDLCSRLKENWKHFKGFNEEGVCEIQLANTKIVIKRLEDDNFDIELIQEENTFHLSIAEYSFLSRLIFNAREFDAFTGKSKYDIKDIILLFY